MSTPTAFISYSWDNETHRAWVKGLATRLRADGINVTLDQWAVAPGDQLPQFMETAVRENDFVLIVLTPNYRIKSDNRNGGVGYEGDIMTGEVFAGKDPRKFIPMIRSGDWSNASPSWLRGKYTIDLRGEPFSETQYKDLLDTLHDSREQAPLIGGRSVTESISTTQKESSLSPDASMLLREASKSLTRRIVARGFGGGWLITTGEFRFAEEEDGPDPKRRVQLIRAIDELCAADLFQSQTEGLYEMTPKGYDYADRLDSH